MVRVAGPAHRGAEAPDHADGDSVGIDDGGGDLRRAEPFWIVCTTVPGPIRGAALAAAAATSKALVATMTRSHGPIPSVVVPAAASLTVRSPLAPSTRGRARASPPRGRPRA